MFDIDLKNYISTLFYKQKRPWKFPRPL